MQLDPLARYIPIADAIARLLAPHAEVVLHDLATRKIRHIGNCFSKRRRGDSSLTDLADLDLRQPVIGPYAKTNWDGRRLKSVSALIQGSARKPIGLLCINQDIEAFSQAAAQLAAWIALPLPTATATALFPGDWRESINQRIATFLAERDATLAGLASADVHALIAALDQSGVFEIRHAVGYVASVLGVSRATLYQRLKTVRAQPVRRSPRQGARHAKPRA